MWTDHGAARHVSKAVHALVGPFTARTVGTNCRLSAAWHPSSARKSNDSIRLHAAECHRLLFLVRPRRSMVAFMVGTYSHSLVRIRECKELARVRGFRVRNGIRGKFHPARLWRVPARSRASPFHWCTIPGIRGRCDGGPPCEVCTRASGGNV